MIDYALAGHWRLYVRALAITETNENPAAPDGDGGRARGILQWHPAAFAEYYGRFGALFPRSVAHTWTQAEIVAAANFFEANLATLGLDLTVQGYNVGIFGVKAGERNVEYLARFDAALNKIRGEHG